MIARRAAERCDDRRLSHATLLNDVNEYIIVEYESHTLPSGLKSPPPLRTSIRAETSSGRSSRKP
jgi:hypothetical protein